MRSVDELQDFAERFALENDSPFMVPGEWDLDWVPDCSAIELVSALADVHENATGTGSGCTGLCAAPVPGGSKNDEVEGVAPASNTGLVKYQFPLTWGGFDGGCEASFLGDWDDRFQQICERLDFAKQAADDGKTAESYIEFGGFVWLVRASGAGVGFFKYKYVMESRGVKLYLHSNPKNGIPPIHVRFGFECLVKTDIFRAVQTLKECFKLEGFEVKEEKISRVDMQVLLPVEVSDFVHAMTGPRVITRCRGTYQQHINMKTGKVETITMHSDNCELCIYDKRSELFQSDPVYFQTFLKYVLRNETANVPEKLTRVEFRFRRSFLQRYGVNTFDDLRNSAYALLEIASQDWFRILSRDKVRGSENEIPDAEIWALTRRAFRFHFKETLPKTRSRTDLKNFKPLKEAAPVERVLKQAVGCLSSACAVLMEKATTGAEVVKFCVDLLEKYTAQMFEKVALKQVFNAVTRDFTQSSRPDYGNLSEIQAALTSLIGEDVFHQYEGVGWEID